MQPVIAVNNIDIDDKYQYHQNDVYCMYVQTPIINSVYHYFIHNKNIFTPNNVLNYSLNSVN